MPPVRRNQNEAELMHCIKNVLRDHLVWIVFYKEI